MPGGVQSPRDMQQGGFKWQRGNRGGAVVELRLGNNNV
jgi:hypothetical protein